MKTTQVALVTHLHEHHAVEAELMARWCRMGPWARWWEWQRLKVGLAMTYCLSPRWARHDWYERVILLEEMAHLTEAEQMTALAQYEDEGGFL